MGQDTGDKIPGGPRCCLRTHKSSVLKLEDYLPRRWPLVLGLAASLQLYFDFEQPILLGEVF